jgi:hypothetical protein
MAEAPHQLPTGDDPSRVVTLNPAFKLVFCSVLGLTVLSLGVSVYFALAYDSPPSEEVKRLIETCSTTWKMGFGAIVGLIGGKAL